MAVPAAVYPPLRGSAQGLTRGLNAFASSALAPQLPGPAFVRSLLQRSGRRLLATQGYGGRGRGRLAVPPVPAQVQPLGVRVVEVRLRPPRGLEAVHDRGDLVQGLRQEERVAQVRVL